MTAPSIGGSAVPGDIADRGVYRFLRQQVRQNGAGAAVQFGEQAATWEFVGMGSTDWDWWMTQWRRGTAMAFELWEDDTRRTSISFSSGYLSRPEYDHIEAKLYMGVKVEIHALMPLQG